jgi:hypothetical protein
MNIKSIYNRIDNSLDLRGTLLHEVSERHIKKIGHSSLQYVFFFSKEHNQIVFGVLRDISINMIQVVHYIVTSDEEEGDMKIKKCGMFNE